MKYSQPSQHLHCKEIRSRNLGGQPLAALFDFGLGRLKCQLGEAARENNKEA